MEGAPGGGARKGRRAALLLCVFLGGLGAHRFYAGRIRTGIVMLALSPWLAAAVWGAIALILIRSPAFSDAVSPVLLLGGISFLFFAGWFWVMMWWLGWLVWWAIDIALICSGEFLAGTARPRAAA